jgi:hypothetical protein
MENNEKDQELMMRKSHEEKRNRIFLLSLKLI